MINYNNKIKKKKNKMIIKIFIYISQACAKSTFVMEYFKKKLIKFVKIRKLDFNKLKIF